MAGNKILKFIDSVGPEGLEEAREAGEVDTSSRELKAAEADYIGRWRKARGDAKNAEDTSNLVGLALSGGGIRSATFSLGIMQALAHRGVLKKVDYLSTVSGGGYIGSAVTWLTSDAAYEAQTESRDKPPKEFGSTEYDFPFGCDDPRPGKDESAKLKQRRMLRFLRDHGYYLTPGAGISAFSLLGAVLRGTLLNLLVWIPVFVLVFLVSLWGATKISESDDWMPVLSWSLATITPDEKCFVPPGGDAGVCKELRAADSTPPAAQDLRGLIESQQVFAVVKERLPQLRWFEIALWFAGLIIASLAALLVLYSLATRWSRGQTPEKREKSYSWRRIVERYAAKAMRFVLFLTMMGVLPLVAVYLHSWLAATGPVAIILGMAISMREFLVSGTRENGPPPELLATVGAGLFLFGVTVISYQLAFWLFGTDWAVLAGLVLAVVALGLGLIVNLNHISIHRYYRDRLMETFMPDIEVAQENSTGKAIGANGAHLQGFARVEKPRGPYHIINTNVVLVNSKVPTYKHRGGDNFILSSLYCGSNATGWCPTEKYMGGRMTLATAVAISGAAANPNTGVGGVGLTRNLFLSLSMSLLNLRLGYWAVRPMEEGCKEELKKGRKNKAADKTPNHFQPGAYSFGNALGIERLGFHEKRTFLQLSDGGHFENMALYELIRRRVKVAIVCDGGADADFSFSDMQTTLRRVEEDFGARIKIITSTSPDQVVPIARSGSVYPKHAEFADQGHMVARITYADQTTGWMIFMKTTLIKDVSFKVKGYKAQNSDFPDQSTVDQFFDEVQFEAYRELGFVIAEEMMCAELPKEVVDSGETASNLCELIGGV